MKISDILPTSEQLSGIQGIEKSLLQRRRDATWWSSAFAIAGAVLQTALLFKSNFDLSKLSPSLQITVFALFVFATGVYFTLRYTSFLFKESEEPFRYTFNICAFTRIDGTPGERFRLAKEDTIKLLHYDLMERLNRRIGRLSLLDDTATTAQKGEDLNLKTHIHVEGEYAIREEKDMGWVLQVMPRVRIGPPTNPFTLAFCVHFPLAKSGTSAELSVEQYEQLTERVHSSIATEIYRQIKIDVENKLSMFPTNYLRAVARYVEARDFENSNTIDSYDRALELYQKALDAFEVSVAQQIRLRLIKQKWFLEWLWVRPPLRAEARTRLGYARCMIYRRIVSELTGRNQNALYGIRDQLFTARDLITRCYNSVMPGEDLKLVPQERDVVCSIQSSAFRGILQFPDDKAFQPHLAETYRALREELAETYAVSALGYSKFPDSLRSGNFLEQAESLKPSADSNKALVLLAKSSCMGDFRQKVSLLRQASEFAPDSEIISYQLAVSLDRLARLQNEINPEQVKVLHYAYDQVLRINPGNVACLIGRGYLSWLVEDFDEADKAYRIADDLKEMVSQTFIGDLTYGRARVAAERAAENFITWIYPDLTEEKRQTARAGALEQIELARQLFVDAVLTDPAVATSYSASLNVRNAYYEFINKTILDRYSMFKDRLEKAISLARTNLWPLEALSIVHTYALNDYGNACLSYYLRFDLRFDKTGSQHYLLTAISALEAAIKPVPNAVAQYNLAIAYGWGTDADYNARQLSHLDEVVARFPTWLEARRVRSTTWASIARSQLESAPQDVKQANQKLEQAQQKLRRAEQELRDKEDLEKEVANAYDKSLEASENQKNTVQNLMRDAQAISQGILNNSMLRPFKDKLALDEGLTKGLDALLDGHGVAWSRLEDNEFFVLAAWAEVVAAVPTPDGNTSLLEASLRVCRHLLRHYSPEYFTIIQVVIRSLLQLRPTTETNQLEIDEYQRTLERILSSEEQADCESALLPYLRASNQDLRAYYIFNRPGDELANEGNFLDSAQQYRQASELCPHNAYYFSNLADVLERQELQLLDSTLKAAAPHTAPENVWTPQQLRIDAIVALEKGLLLDPANQDLNTRLISLRSRDWAAKQGIYSRLKAYTFTDLLEIQVSESLMPNLFKEDNSLIDDFQKEVNTLRAGMLTLPSVIFRDNKSFTAGQFKLFVRGIEVDSGNCTDQNSADNWKTVADGLKKVAKSHMAEYFGPQDAVKAIREVTDGTPDLQFLADSTIVLRGLLSEGVSVRPENLPGIASCMLAAQSAGSDLLSMHEQIRSSLALRLDLVGNSGGNYRFLRLSPQLDDAIYQCVDTSWGEPSLNANVQQAIALMKTIHPALMPDPAKKPPALLASTRTRAFARILTQPAFPEVPVLSDREILLPLLAQVECEI